MKSKQLLNVPIIITCCVNIRTGAELICESARYAFTNAIDQEKHQYISRIGIYKEIAPTFVGLRLSEYALNRACFIPIRLWQVVLTRCHSIRG